MSDDYNAREWSLDDERCSQDDFLCRICGSESASSICRECDLVRQDGVAIIDDLAPCGVVNECAMAAHDARWDGDTIATIRRTRDDLRKELAALYLAATGEKL